MKPRTPTGKRLLEYLRAYPRGSDGYPADIIAIEDEASTAAETTASWNADYADRLILQSQAAEADAAALAEALGAWNIGGCNCWCGALDDYPERPHSDGCELSRAALDAHDKRIKP
jgi:hypothetical protein